MWLKTLKDTHNTSIYTKYQVSNRLEFKLMTNYLIGLIYRKSVPYVTKIQILAILSLELVLMVLIILVSTNSDKNTSNKKKSPPPPH